MVEKVDICDISIKESMKKLVAFNLRIMFVIFLWRCIYKPAFMYLIGLQDCVGVIREVLVDRTHPLLYSLSEACTT